MSRWQGQRRRVRGAQTTWAAAVLGGLPLAQTELGSFGWSGTSALWLLASLVALAAGLWLLAPEAGRRRLAAGMIVTLVGGCILAVRSAAHTAGQNLTLGWILLAVALAVVLQTQHLRRWWAVVLGALAALLLLDALDLVRWSAALYGILGGVIVLAAVATISSRNPLYSAVWFALTLLGVGGWLLVSGAQFLGIATVAVYAGAIVVTFLFVLMLAQPGGKAYYDRISWGRLPIALASGSGALLVGLVVLALARSNLTAWTEPELVEPVQAAIDGALDNGALGTGGLGTEGLADGVAEQEQPAEVHAVRVAQRPEGTEVRVTATAPGGRPWTRSEYETVAEAVREGLVAHDPARFSADGDWHVELTDAWLASPRHMALMGRELFGRHLVAVEVAGVLLYLALVGAVAMAHGTPATAEGGAR